MIETTEILAHLTQSTVIRIILILLLFWGGLRGLQWFLPWFTEQIPSRFRLYVLPLMPILQLMLVILALMRIVPLVIDPTPENVLAISGAVAITIGFAFQDYVSSLIAGIVAIYERPYRIGDWVRIGDAYGEVIALGFRSIQLVTPDDTVVLIPHKLMWDSIIFNDNSGQREHQCVADFYLQSEHDAETVRQKLRQVALTSPYLQLDRPISVIVIEKPWGTHYRLKAYPIDGRDQFKFTSDMTVRGKAALSRLGVRPANAPVSVAV